MTAKKPGAASTAPKKLRASKVTVANVPSEVPATDGPLQMPDMSTSFAKNLDNIKAGKKMLLDSEPGFHFILVGERLEKRSKGGLVDSKPLYSYQDISGWRVKK